MVTSTDLQDMHNYDCNIHCYRDSSIKHYHKIVFMFTNGPMFIPSRRGNKILIYNGHTYNQSHCSVYYCTRKYLMKCQARVKLDQDNVIVDMHEFHNHEPPTIHKTIDGYFAVATNANNQFRKGSFHGIHF